MVTSGFRMSPSNLPPIPEGFKLVDPATLPPVPKGFTLGGNVAPVKEPDLTQGEALSMYPSLGDIGGGLKTAVVGAADNVLPTIRSAVAGSAAALAKMLLGQSPSSNAPWSADDIERAIANFGAGVPVIGQPVTEPGKALRQGVGEMREGTAALAKHGLQKADQALHTGDENGGVLQNTIGTIGEATGDALALLPLGAGAKAGAGMATARTAKTAAKAATEAATEFTPAETLRAAGLKLAPSSVRMPGQKPGAVARTVESVSGPREINAAAAEHNIPVLQNRIAKDNGLDLSRSNGLFTEEVLGDAWKKQNAAWDAVEKLPGDRVDLKDAIRSTSTSLDTMQPYLDKLANDYGMVESSTGAVAATRKLRADARRLMRSQDPAMQERGQLAKSTADKIDDVLSERAAQYGSPEVYDNFEKSRVAMAKLHHIDEATVAGTIDPHKLKAMRDRGVPLDEGMGLAAYAAEHAPDVTKHLSKYKPDSNSAAHSLSVRALAAATRNLGGKTYLMGPAQKKLGGVDTAALERFYPTKDGARPRPTPKPQPDLSMLRGGPSNRATPGPQVPSDLMNQGAPQPDLSMLRGGPSNRSNVKAGPADLMNEAVPVYDSLGTFMFMETAEQARRRLLAEQLRKK